MQTAPLSLDSPRMNLLAMENDQDKALQAVPIPKRKRPRETSGLVEQPVADDGTRKPMTPKQPLI